MDDLWGSRRTAPVVKERVPWAGDVPRVATLHFKPGKNRVQGRPDFYAEAPESWVVYPWAVEVWGEDLKSRVRRLQP